MVYDTDLLNTKKRLTEWGNWCYRITTMGLGYSNRTLLAKLQEEGGMIIQGTAKILIPTNEKAEEMNDLVEQLAMDKPEGAGKPEWAKIIRVHYTMQEKDIIERIQLTALPKRTYYHYLKCAQTWLSEIL
ncbi:MAG: hypothetical protein COY58_00530 [Gammaproteobacteria bacterium CG_4_10_14_0_8_um_filter_38_16]|nr:MAG: hypothetical protein COY58_00530 [Gammaproteobacteria bacterium CG_4_10_14_0_8_um_filter_38_16]PJA04244.1 MAG: hypothetical protein COX72_01330 [Gammaproteobacteria bacterium CG_4_10_14_0_2_um_filter_38_22]PJB10928.1 MAG: hypothetical protein CO120_02295 [Gammaproteobacteria bacterium CG_4_9_14_3_um_filter_38_9]